MSTAEDRARRVTFYLGKRHHPSKEEVADFIKFEMGLISGGDPKWTDGLCELIDVGMDAWLARKEGVTESDARRVVELEEKLAGYRVQVEELQKKLDKCERNRDQRPLDAAERVHRVEARILEVLCREENLGAKSPNFVDLYNVTEATGLRFDTVIHYASVLSRSEFGERVLFDESGNRIKASSEDSFNRHCEAVRVDPDEIREANE